MGAEVGGRLASLRSSGIGDICAPSFGAAPAPWRFRRDRSIWLLTGRPVTLL
jgi:hypothetical protein